MLVVDEPALAAYRRAALRAFLMSRRARLQPEDVGLPRRVRQRTAGLNREEVALLAGITPYWYERFETQRDARPGTGTLNALGDALRLSDAERAYLRLLSIGEEPPQRLPHPDELWAIADASDAVAFAVFDAGYQRLRANRLHDAIFGYDLHAPPLEHNAVYRMFADRARRTLWDSGWERAAARMVGKLRWLCAFTGNEPSIVSTMFERDDDFRRFWEGHEVDVPDTVRDLELVHPRAGAMRLRVYAPRMQTGYLCGFYAPIDAETAAAVRGLL